MRFIIKEYLNWDRSRHVPGFDLMKTLQRPMWRKQAKWDGQDPIVSTGMLTYLTVLLTHVRVSVVVRHFGSKCYSWQMKELTEEAAYPLWHVPNMLVCSGRFQEEKTHWWVNLIFWCVSQLGTYWSISVSSWSLIACFSLRLFQQERFSFRADVILIFRTDHAWIFQWRYGRNQIFQLQKDWFRQ